MIARFAAAALAALLLAPAPALAAAPFYDNAVVRFPKVRKDRMDLYRRSVVASLARGRIRSVSLVRDGKTKKLARRGDGVKKLKPVPLAGIAAIAYTGGQRFRGSELDLLVTVGSERVPVTLWHSGKGDVTVRVGKRMDHKPAFGGDTSTDRQEIRRRYDSGAIKGAGATWKARELKVLSGALDRLNRQERRVLDDVKIVRSRAGPRGPRNAALYIWGTEGYRLMVYDRAFAFDGRAFVGGPSKPRPFSSSAILHEVGHAIATWPARKLIEKGDISRARKVGRRGPVLSAYARARGDRKGPTRYGRSSLAESFSEAFALHKLDPAALKRWSPRVAEWFAEGGHIDSME
ncbi:MAG: hypothetical protein GY898_21285 [Proteobacteria bacterium]|nr:hypothetical protein [Pseudomonadota bacterium]